MNIPFSPPDISEAEIQEVASALRSGWITTGPKTKELERQVAAFCGVNRAVCLNSQTISEAEIQEVASALRSGWITTGPKTKELERQVAAFCGVNRAVCLNSQTACAEMALRVLGVGPGDEVIVPAYTYTASASVVCHVGAKLVLVDCQKDSFEMDYDQMRRKINERTKAVIPVDLGGVPCDYDRIFEIVEEKRSLFRPKGAIQTALGRVAVMADTAHAFGAARKGKPAGSLADFSSFSFHAVKNFTTAEGGALTWNPIAGVPDEEIYHQLQLLSLHGQSKDALAKTQLGAWEYDIVGPWYKCNMTDVAADEEIYHQLQLLSLHGQSKDALAKTQLGAWEYDIVGPWYKCNMTDVAAAMGLAQMKRYPGMLERRKQIIERYDAAFCPLGVEVLPHYTGEHQSSGHLYITRVPGITLEQRNDIIVKMAQRGIACNVHYKPLPMHTAYKALGFAIGDFPNAYARFANEITLPLHTCLTDEQVAYVIDNYTEILREYLR